MLPACQLYGMGAIAWSPLAKGMLTGKYRKGRQQPESFRAKFMPKAMTDEGSLHVVEQLLQLAEEAGISLPHMALAFVMTHPALSAAIIGPRTMEQLDGYLAGAELALSDEVLDRIDEIVPPGVDVAPLEGAAYSPPSILQARLRRLPAGERAAV